jgi:DNA-binding SARP family transcriptional activator/tetratricopeptide (TPR) repeat protein
VRVIRLYLFGAPRLERDGLLVTTDTKKAVALMAYLVVTGRAHTRETLAALLWGDTDEQHARGALRRTLSVLRSAAGDATVQTNGDLIRAGAGVWCDVTAFRAALAGSEADATAGTALAAGPFMSGFNVRDAPDFEEWQLLEGEALNRELAGALHREAEQRAARADYDGAIQAARRLLALDTLNEEAHRLLMRLYAFSGEQGAALRQYRSCVRVLEQELGVTPLPETAELYRAIRENQLIRPSPDAGRQATLAKQESPAEPSRAPQPLALVGRGKEWSALTRLYEHEAAEGYCVALEGEAGIGKTRLAEEFLAFAQARGARISVGRCYEGETGLAYAVVLDLLRRLMEDADCPDRLAGLPPGARWAAARLLPELGAEQPFSASDPGAGARFFEGLAQFLAGLCPRGAPTVLLFDDLHWVDEASLDFLSYFARRLAGRAVCLVFSWRGDGSSQVERLRLLLAELGRAGRGQLLRLRRLSQADVLALAETAKRPEIAEQVYRESEGVPLFVAAYLDAVHRGEGETALPATIRDLLSARVAGVTDAERQLLQAAAVLGRSFDLDALQATSGRSSDETLAGVERMMERGLLREAPGQGTEEVYDFDHDKLRGLVYETTGAGRRRLLHERAARAWLAVGARRRTGLPVAALAAHHFQLAARNEEAAHQHALAARHAARVYANADAIGHYRSALELGYEDSAELREAIADLEALRGNYGAAQAEYELAAAQTREGAAEAGRIDHKLANLRARLGEWDAAEICYQAAEQALHAGAAPERAKLYADWALAAHQRGNADRARQLIERALPLASAAADSAALAQAHNAHGVLQRARGDLTGAIRSLELACALAEKLDDPAARVAALNNLALATAETGDLARGEQLLRAALAEAVLQGDRHREAGLRNNLADLLRLQGRDEEAMAELKQAVALFAEVGAQAGAPRAEIWKLSEW